MQIRADFDAVEVVDLATVDWQPSPMPGVERKMLDRIGGEVARATSVVRYAAASRFNPHRHDGGEEFLVLDGTFGDEHGRYPKFTYVRNPPGTSHSPVVADGCTILVKLRQFAADDLTPVRIATAEADGWRAMGGGAAVRQLHRHGSEDVRLLRLDPGASADLPGPAGGLEVFLVEGSVLADDGPHDAWAWFRRPAGAGFTVRAAAPCLLFVKQGHLPAE